MNFHAILTPNLSDLREIWNEISYQIAIPRSPTYLLWEVSKYQQKMLELPLEYPLCEQSKTEYILTVKFGIVFVVQVGILLHTGKNKCQNKNDVNLG